ncbi:DUF3883 domain-containing protein [Pseudovibrio sp. Tun.PSC04-5.I4]|uniref:sacsin N-terminal ATP-binding-like domain-containing protein n=1 Tax=Pseudovibrio sp. Tun.PSC04-5.I4 TaxID=1798213 RepID=UPI000883905A|nr:DUF3883 domain-containing protein [Pseudovibrio sp. Tun.PSC04-5.I4]SDR40087.1 protein of unknown function [Pseudovibrio sp. Tun.PSC04-5.I4]
MACSHVANNEDKDCLKTSDAWDAFIASELQASCNAYLEKPAFLLGHSRAEKQVTADYADRELLELVQNAADAASDAGGTGKVLIEVSEGALFVANTGKLFQMSGLKSLMTAHTSDKPTKAALMIGAKGLGFRAILNWTEAPIIFSGDLELGFSRSHAHAVVAELARKNAEIAANFASSNTNQPPLLAFPARGAELDVLEEDKLSLVLKRARQLRADGYDTVIAAPLRDGNALNRAIDQVREFEPSFLLFVRAIQSIRIRLPDHNEKCWTKIEKEDGYISLVLKSHSETSTQDWILRHKFGKVGEGEFERGFELAIAIRTGQDNSFEKLHCYFPTSLPLPFCGLFHATLELDSSRKTINAESELNRKVLAALGRFHAEVLDDLREAGRIEEPLLWLVPGQAFPDPIKPIADAAWERASTLPLVLCRDDVWRTPVDARIGPKRYADYLPARLFGRLAKVEDSSVEDLLREQFKVSIMDPQYIVKELRHAELSTRERATAIVGLARFVPENAQDTRLFIDISGKNMKATSCPFPAPSKEMKHLALPTWANARFICPELWTELLAVSKEKNIRDTIQMLKGFQVTEYSADAVVGALRKRANELLKKGHAPDKLQASFLATIYALHDQSRNRPPGVFKVKCKDGCWHDITSVHLSESYSSPGEITSALYSGHPEVLVGSPSDNGLDETNDDLAQFLVWLGINQWPRKVTEDLPVKWREHIIGALPEEFTVSDGNTIRQVQHSDLRWDYNCKATHETVFGLDQILMTTPSDVILAWLAYDDRLDPLAAEPSFKVNLQARESGHAKFRPYLETLPSTIHLEIQSRPWLESKENKHCAPRDMMIAPGVLSALFKAPHSHDTNSQSEFPLKAAIWRRGLERAGVVRNLDDLPEQQIYHLLLSLPSLNVKPEVAGRLYLQILERDSFDPKLGGQERDKFITEGFLPIQNSGQRSWCERQGVYYAHRNDLPASARTHLRLIDLPSRRNAKHVEARFGVPTLSKDELNLRLCLINKVSSVLSEEIVSRYNRAKPYILAFRSIGLSYTAIHQRFKSTTLTVARKVEIEFSINAETIKEQLEPWQHSLDKEQIVITIDDTGSQDEIISQSLRAISDGIAEIFELQNGAAFFPYLMASSEKLLLSQLKHDLTSFSEEELVSLIKGTDRAFESPYAPDVDAETLASGPAPGSSHQSNDVDPTYHQANKSPEGKVEADNDPRASGPDVKLAVQPRDMPPSTSPTTNEKPKRTLRVARPTGPIGSPKNSDNYRTADAEHWTKAFEIEEGRWPLTVAHLQGNRSFGCDFLSFDTEEKRATFKENPDQIDLINRFIETKSGSIKFTDNEWAAANSFQDRYFIYQVFFISGGRDLAQLTIIQNPVALHEAIRIERELQIEKVVAPDVYDLIPKANNVDDTDGVIEEAL